MNDVWYFAFSWPLPYNGLHSNHSLNFPERSLETFSLMEWIQSWASARDRKVQSNGFNIKRISLSTCSVLGGQVLCTWVCVCLSVYVSACMPFVWYVHIWDTYIKRMCISQSMLRYTHSEYMWTLHACVHVEISQEIGVLVKLPNYSLNSTQLKICMYFQGFPNNSQWGSEASPISINISISLSIRWVGACVGDTALPEVLHPVVLWSAMQCWGWNSGPCAWHKLSFYILDLKILAL